MPTAFTDTDETVIAGLASKCNARQKVFCEHFAVHGDWNAGAKHAYPKNRAWTKSDMSTRLAELRKSKAVVNYIIALRAGSIKQIGIDYKWLVAETVAQYRKADAEGNIGDALRALALLMRLTNNDPYLTAKIGNGEKAQIQGRSDTEDAQLIPTEELERIVRYQLSITGSDVSRTGPPDFEGRSGVLHDIERGPPTTQSEIVLSDATGDYYREK